MELLNDDADDSRAFLDVGGLGVMSRAAFMLHSSAIVNSFQDGTPGFISDGYLSAISAETTVTAMELETLGLWERRESGYFIKDEDTIKMMLDHNEQMERLAVDCEERGAHLPDDDGGEWVVCTHCAVPLVRPDGGPVGTSAGGRPVRDAQ